MRYSILVYSFLTLVWKILKTKVLLSFRSSFRYYLIEILFSRSFGYQCQDDFNFLLFCNYYVTSIFTFKSFQKLKLYSHISCRQYYDENKTPSLEQLLWHVNCKQNKVLRIVMFKLQSIILNIVIQHMNLPYTICCT